MTITTLKKMYDEIGYWCDNLDNMLLEDGYNADIIARSEALSAVMDYIEEIMVETAGEDIKRLEAGGSEEVIGEAGWYLDDDNDFLPEELRSRFEAVYNNAVKEV